MVGLGLVEDIIRVDIKEVKCTRTVCRMSRAFYTGLYDDSHKSVLVGDPCPTTFIPVPVPLVECFLPASPTQPLVSPSMELGPYTIFFPFLK